MVVKRAFLSSLVATALVFGTMPSLALAEDGAGAFDEPAGQANGPAESAQVDAQVAFVDAEDGGHSDGVDDAPASEDASMQAAFEGGGPEASSNAYSTLDDIAFVYIESPEATRDSVENIVIGFADDALVVRNAELDIANPAGDVVTVSQSDAVEGAVLFTMSASSLDVGSYELRELRYDDVSGERLVASFADDAEVDYLFAITAATSATVSEDVVETCAYAIDPDGEYVRVDSIGDAMKAAGVDPGSGPASLGLADANDASMTAQAGDGFVIVLDPGHGGRDGGAVGYGLEESDVNLKIAQYCKAKLEQTPGVTVYMTRTSDVYVELSDRTQIAVNHNADLVVSIHNNAGGGSGSEVIVPRNGTWYYETTYLTGTELGSKILGKLNALGLRTHGGVYSRDCTTGETYPDGTLSDYYSLIDGPRSNGILGIIVEHAFIDNAGDAAYLNNDASLKSLGEADANAIIEYYSSSTALDRLYWGVFDYDYYTSHYADAKEYGSNKLQVLGHFKKIGMSEGRRANILFDPAYYKSTYSDLQKAYGSDYVKYYRHFMNSGMAEGRQGSPDFIPQYYRSNYPDLGQAFGSNWTNYYKHYVQYGAKEGRIADKRVTEPASSNAPAGSSSVYRMYNPYSGEHHYTLGADERDWLMGLGWRYEGVAWYAPKSSSVPVYRMYNPYSGDHHYTTGADERDWLKKIGWNYEGVAWYSDDAKGVALYRMFNPNVTIGTHHYTPGADERDWLKKIGWNYEGVAWYGMK